MSITRLSTKGQLVIPSRFRKALHLQPGDRVSIKLEGEKLVVQPEGAARARLVEEKGRKVLVAPPGSHGTRLLLAKAASANQSSRVGNQTGGRVFLFLHTDDFWRDYSAFRARGVQFREEPRKEPYGTVAVFNDIYGNCWDLIQPTR